MEQLCAQRACPDRSTARVTAVTFKMHFHLLPTIFLLYVLELLRIVPTLYRENNWPSTTHSILSRVTTIAYNMLS